jgi:hypothetical protein
MYSMGLFNMVEVKVMGKNKKKQPYPNPSLKERELED